MSSAKFTIYTPRIVGLSYTASSHLVGKSTHLLADNIVHNASIFIRQRGQRWHGLADLLNISCMAGSMTQELASDWWSQIQVLIGYSQDCLTSVL